MITILNKDILNVNMSEYQGYTIITDPPFNIGYKYDVHSDNMDEESYWEMLSTTCKLPSVVIHYPEELFKLSLALGVFPEKMVAWVYNSNTRKQWRGIAWFGCKPDFSLAGQPYKNPKDKRVAKLIQEGRQCCLYDWWEINQVKNVSFEKTKHPCQMPLEVMLRILKITKPKKVLDPFMGSGTTLVACKMLGIEAVGIDKSAEYCKIAESRLYEIQPPSVPKAAY